MYGEGYDYAPQYTARSGDIVGSLPVGMKSRGNRDLPYWPVTNIWNYKEVWVHPVSRWIWLMADVDGPAIVSGQVQLDGDSSVVITEKSTGASAQVPRQLTVSSVNLRSWVVWPGSISSLPLMASSTCCAPRT